jgi:signal transduction histidine kinase
VETVRKSLSHDVRTPLGTIVNYAAVLESLDEPQPQEVRALARKVRDNAMRAAGMLQQLSDAVAVLTRSERASEFEIASLLATCLQSSLPAHTIEVAPNDNSPPLRGHVALLAFLWKAVFRFDRELRGRALERVEFDARVEPCELHLAVWLGPRPHGQLPPLDLSRVLREDGARLPVETRMALELGLGLVEASGGSCVFHGKPGEVCEVQLVAPIAA